MYQILVIILAIIPVCAYADIASTSYVAEQTENQVKTTGNQEIAGVKTYSESPVVPTPPLPEFE